jgi:hypothetical protein
VDRDALVRAARRRQAEEALAVERDREAMLASEVEDLLAEADGSRLDAELYARMDDGAANLVAAALGQWPGPDGDTDPDDAWDAGFEEEAEDEEPEDAEPVEAEVERLREEIEGSRATQAALLRYLELLDEPPPAEPGP